MNTANAAASTPVAGEAQAAAPSGDSGADNAIDWGFLDSHDGDEDSLSLNPPSEPTPPTGTENEVPPAEPPAAIESPPVAPLTEQQPPPVAEAPVVPQEPQPPAEPQVFQQTPEQIAQLRAAYIDQVAQAYQLSDDDATRLVTDPNTVLPKLAATLHANVLEQASRMVVQTLQQTLPNFFEGYMQQKQSVESGENEFYGQWKELAPHKDRVFQIASMYRQLNPQATKEQFMKDVGMQAWLALGLPIGELEAKLNPSSTQNPAPPQPPLRTPQGYSPANPGGALPAPRGPSDNPFERLLDEWADEL